MQKIEIEVIKNYDLIVIPNLKVYYLPQITFK